MIRRRAGGRRPSWRRSATQLRATGITPISTTAARSEHAQEMAAHESPRTTKLYDRTKNG